MWTSFLTIAIVINEVMASNAGLVMSPATNFDSWIELYNPTTETVNLSGMYLSNDVNNLKLWQMPDDVGSVPAGGYRVVWLGSNDIKSNQATFKLDCDGGTVYLSDQQGELVTSMQYPEARSRTAYARTTDGGDEWGWTSTPTPGATNQTAVFASERLTPPEVSHDSQLFNGLLTVKVSIPEGATLMYTTDGSLPTAPETEEPGGAASSPWKEYVINGDCEGSDATSLVSRDADGNGDVNRIVDGVGYENSRSIRIHCTANAVNDWDAQLFVFTPDHVWQAGEHYRFRMMARADKGARMTTQTHSIPHGYISSNVLNGSYNVGTDWQEITYEGVITEQQSGGGSDWWTGEPTPGTMQTLVFNLNVDRKENYFYFDNVSWELLTEEEEKTPASSHRSDDGVFTVSATASYTFRLFQDGYLPSTPVTRSYIKTANSYTLPVVSIVGDKRFFTDPKIGLDCDGDGTNGKTGNGQDRPHNYNQPWDRPVNISYMTPEGKMLYNQDVNIKVSGGWTRAQRYRSFKLKASKIFDGQNRYDYPFFPQKPYIRSKTLLLRNGGNDVWLHNARFMDPALETIIQRSGIDVDVQSYQPVIEYVNGELRGVLNLREPNNDDFAYANFGYDDEELDAFENMVMQNGDDAVINRIFELGRQSTDDAAYEELKTLLDIDEFTNYMAVTMFLDNDDWPNNNIKGYRSRNDGRYRFVSFDLDYAFALRGFNKDNDNPFAYFLRFKDAATVYGENNFNRDIVRLLLNLWKRDDYRRKFIDTFSIIAGSVFEPNRAGQIVDELLAAVQPMCQLMKRQGINDGHDPERAASDIKTRLRNRAQKMAGHMKACTNLKLSNLQAQQVTLNATQQGARLFINGLEVPYAYFNGYLFGPVQLTAIAPAGYVFTGWQKGSAVYSTAETATLPADGTVAMTATFRPLTDIERMAQGCTPVRVNEVSAQNSVYVNDQFKRNDWVELYNTTSLPVDVEGMYLSDNAKKPLKFKITKGDSQASTVIQPYGYLVIWCDKLEPLSQLHADFKLAAEGGDVLLTAADETWTDKLTYTTHNGDQTVGRYPDGSSKVYVMNVPTIAKANLTSTYAVDITGGSSTGITEIMAQQNRSQQTYDLRGQAVQGTLKPGLYIRNGRKVIIK